MELNEFILKDVRCFAGEQRVRLAPLTFLVGENSTGKSSVLGCYHAFMNMKPNTAFPVIDFNIPPYEMGTCREIVRKGEENFSLGFSFPVSDFISDKAGDINGDRSLSGLIEFGLRGASPFIKKVIYFMPDQAKVTLHYQTDERGDNTWIIQDIEIVSGSGELQEVSLSEKKSLEKLMYLLSGGDISHINADDEDDALLKAAAYIKPIDRELRQLGYIISIAPVRFKPRRTYDPIAIIADPEGNEVPMYLRRLKSSNNGQYKALSEALAKFGKASGLFDKIDVKTFSRDISDPFHLEVKVRGHRVNLADVGYGVSQILPVLVRMFADDKSATLLIQEPEIHLHPRAQAELVSLFASAIAEKRQKFIIETHGDFMVDRACIEIRQGRLKPDDVSLVYFEPLKNGVKIHNIGFDDAGNLINVPEGYRDFFLKESDRYLGFAD